MATATSEARRADEAELEEDPTATRDPDIDAELESVDDLVQCDEGDDWNVVERAFLTRRSIRKFKKKQVPAHLIRRMLEIGRFAPSQGNCQPYRFAVVREAELLIDMEKYCVEQCKKISEAADYTQYEKGTMRRFASRTIARIATASDPNATHPVPMTVLTSIANGDFMVFHKAPTVILILIDKRGVGVPEIDIGIVGTNIVMAAESQRLGTCWIGFSKLLNDSKEWRERLGVDDRFEVSEAICVGYPVGKPWQNLIDRPMHEITWFEDGKTKILA